LDSAVRYYQAALGQWSALDRAGRAKVLRKLGECQWVRGQLQDALATFEATTAAYPGYKRRLEISGERGTVVVEHDRVIVADLAPGSPPFAASTAAAVGESAASHLVSDATPHRRIFEDFPRARDGARPICDGRRAAQRRAGAGVHARPDGSSYLPRLPTSPRA
jgi:predicted dehydrogenase